MKTETSTFNTDIELLETSPNLSSMLKELKTLKTNENCDNIPISGHGACESCGCKGYRPGKRESYCKCDHHFYQHKSKSWF